MIVNIPAIVVRTSIYLEVFVQFFGCLQSLCVTAACLKPASTFSLCNILCYTNSRHAYCGWATISLIATPLYLLQLHVYSIIFLSMYTISNVYSHLLITPFPVYQLHKSFPISHSSLAIIEIFNTSTHVILAWLFYSSCFQTLRLSDSRVLCHHTSSHSPSFLLANVIWQVSQLSPNTFVQITFTLVPSLSKFSALDCLVSLALNCHYSSSSLKDGWTPRLQVFITTVLAFHHLTLARVATKLIFLTQIISLVVFITSVFYNDLTSKLCTTD